MSLNPKFVGLLHCHLQFYKLKAQRFCEKEAFPRELVVPSRPLRISAYLVLVFRGSPCA